MTFVDKGHDICRQGPCVLLEPGPESAELPRDGCKALQSDKSLGAIVIKAKAYHEDQAVRGH